MWKSMTTLHLISIATALAVPGICLAASSGGDSYVVLLNKYVTPQGVRYDRWRATPGEVKALSDVVASLSAIDPKLL